MKAFPLTWETLDWSALDRLRDTFLAGKSTGASCWSSCSDLANYDFTFAQRIGWKWGAVLRELKQRGWTPPPGRPLLDWGCGSGVAGRCVVEFFGGQAFECLRVFDRSPLAMEFAMGSAREQFPAMRVEAVDAARLSETGGSGVPVGTLVISHVLNELDETGGRALRQVIDRADAVLWVEPGTYAVSRMLITRRENLREQFLLIAPCTHQAACGLLTPENERHWCHHFASPPAGIMADSNWVRFAQRAGIDLRSLTYSFLVLERKGLRDPVPGLLPDGWSRIIGEPRLYKGYAKIFSCQADGVRDLTLQKRDARAFFAMMKRGDQRGYHRWSFNKDRILGAE
jgi:hypothetical protein